VLCRLVAIVEAFIVIFSFGFILPSWEFKCIAWSCKKRLKKKLKRRKEKSNVL